MLARLSDNYWLAGEWDNGGAITYGTPRDLEYTRDIDPTVPPEEYLSSGRDPALPQVARHEISPPLCREVESWVFDDRVSRDRLRAGLYPNAGDFGEWLLLYRFSSISLDDNAKAHRLDEYHSLQMIGLPEGERAAFRRRTREANVDFHSWLGEELTDGPFLYELGNRATWPAQEWITTNEWRGGDFDYLSFSQSYRWEWHLDGSLPDGLHLRAPSSWLIAELSVKADPYHSGVFRQENGSCALISGHDETNSYCLVRGDAFKAVLERRKVLPIWLGCGERTASHKNDDSEVLRRRWNGLMWHQANGERFDIWNDDYRG